jgi:hypothetical protein
MVPIQEILSLEKEVRLNKSIVEGNWSFLFPLCPLTRKLSAGLREFSEGLGLI